ncbi:aldehyde dehydrogenase [Thermoleptolyngbya sichuanensis A183]|uniref:Aldehyde dehydrogenase n=1 Tax=Thermoleptolyngbya sichuanensis A183 TaxID=2737172 RepID=A0A6M8BGR9_9CYAN|nr:aldehyde dehydrogenase family protein [Thermoleptolyngbya sichuanensis]QKD83516.1 aldehyde dehydrogenase [Thermoleptolyngbya sichuanensis A183]
MTQGFVTQDLLIGGDRLPADSGQYTELIDPATGDAWIKVAAAAADDVDRAVQVADQVRSPWRRVNSRDRTQLLLKLATLIRENLEPLAQLESRNVGKPIRDARDEVNLAADCFEYYAGVVNKIGGQTTPVAAAGTHLTFREPIGVCGLIAPWNFPIAITAWKVAPALAMGNPVVLKPATQTPLTALRLGELALEAGIPPGVFNVVPGAGSVAGEALLRHPLVRKISFTGSTEIGMHVMRTAADDLKRVTLELGGKSANLVFADADLDLAVPKVMWSVLGNAGQDCCARSRLLIQRPVYDEFLHRLTQQFQALRIGPPLDESTEIGTLISTQQRDRVLDYITLGQQEGATLLCGGTVPTESPLDRGAYLTPALFAHATPNMRIAQEEIFGPVLCAIPFDTEEEAVAIANTSLYGLSGSIWTRDIGRALRIARAIETGVLSINTGHSVHLEAPFGGVKHSGIGRELGLAVLDHYSEWKSIFIAE